MNTKLLLQTKARNTPWILEGFWRLRNRDKMQSSARTRRVVERGDPVCIEGYPRSANTFACDAFVLAQGKSLANVPTEGYPIPMGNHFHSPAQFHLAKKYGVPALLVLREPMDAALSWVVFSDGDMGPEATLRSYVNFTKPARYRRCVRHRAIRGSHDRFRQIHHPPEPALRNGLHTV